MSLVSSAAEHCKALIRNAWYGRSRVGLLNFPVRCRLPDGSVFLAHGDAMGWAVFSRRLPLATKSHEENSQKFLLRLLIPGMRVIDVGANQGFYTLLAARRVGPTGKVFALEPASTEFEKLQKNVAENGYTNIVSLQTAVGASEGETEFFLCLDGRGTFSSRRPAHDLQKVRQVAVRVPITTLDALCARHGIVACDLIKIDVEGGEREVLRGASHVLSSLRPAIMCELADIRTKAWNYPAREIYQFLENRGYDWWRAAADGRLTMTPCQERYDPDWQDLIAIPRERKEELSSSLPELR